MTWKTRSRTLLLALLPWEERACKLKLLPFFRKSSPILDITTALLVLDVTPSPAYTGLTPIWINKHQCCPNMFQKTASVQVSCQSSCNTAGHRESIVDDTVFQQTSCAIAGQRSNWYSILFHHNDTNRQKHNSIKRHPQHSGSSKRAHLDTQMIPNACACLSYKCL